MVLVGIAVIIGITIQRLVQRVRERGEEAARGREFVLAVMNSAGEGIISIDTHGRVEYANPAGCAMLGYERDEIRGEEFHALVHHTRVDGSSFPHDECPIHETMQHGTEQEIDNDLFWRKDGSSFPVHYKSSAIDSQSDSGVVVTFTDITQRRRIEKMKDELVSVVSHELRTPLTSIRGSLGLIAGGAAGEIPREAERMIGIAVTNTDRLVRLINEILDIERIESGRAEMSRRLCDSEDLMEHAVATMASQAEAEGTWIELRALLGAALGGSRPDHADAHEPALERGQVLPARRAGASAGDRDRRARSASRSSIAAAASPPTSSRASSSASARSTPPTRGRRAAPGSGCRSPAASCISTADGCGRRALRARERRWPSRFPPSPPAESAADDEGRDGRLALVIEDDPDLTQVLDALLTAEGLNVWTAPGATEAVKLLGRRRPDLIVLDLALPDADGSELVRWMRGQPELVDVPLAVYTVRDLDRPRSRATAARSEPARHQEPRRGG